MTEPSRLVKVVLAVADLDRSAALYRDGFGVPLKPPDDHEGGAHGTGDRWVSGRHCATSWTEGAFLHFALYAARADEVTTHAQVGFRVDDLDAAHLAAVNAGAVVMHEPRAEAWGRSARYRDFDGNIVELTQPG
jgi:predicted enzyme related to lactoylglutathione lyase